MYGLLGFTLPLSDILHVTYPQSTISTKETFLQYFLVILKHSLHNYKKILKTYIHKRTIVTSVLFQFLLTFPFWNGKHKKFSYLRAIGRYLYTRLSQYRSMTLDISIEACDEHIWQFMMSGLPNMLFGLTLSNITWRTYIKPIYKISLVYCLNLSARVTQQRAIEYFIMLITSLSM